MNWLEKVRLEPKEKRLRILWTIVLIAAILLIIAWIIIGNYSQGAKGDTSLFQAANQAMQKIRQGNFKTSGN